MKPSLIIPSNNVFEQRQKEFLASKTAARLAKKFTPKTYQERFKHFRLFALIASYLANGFSALSASTYVFSYSIAILFELPNPEILALVITAIGLIGIETLQRMLAPSMFKEGLQFGFSSTIWRLGAISILSGCSLLFSYKGGYDIVKVVKTAPIIEKPVLHSISDIKSDYNTRIGEAKERAAAFKAKRLWHGRLSNVDSRRHEKLLDKVVGLQSEKQSKIEKYQGKNDDLNTKAENNYHDALGKYNDETEATGMNLAHFAIISQALFFLCVFYVEYYDYRVAGEFAIIEGVSQVGVVGGLADLRGGNYNSQKIGFKTTSNNNGLTGRNNPETMLEQKLTPSNTRNYNTSPTARSNSSNNQPKTRQKTQILRVHTKDQHTIQHQDQRTGETKYYGLSQVNNFIKSYEARVLQTEKEINALRVKNEDTRKKEKTLEDRRNALAYWQSRREELYSLINQSKLE